MQRTFNGGSSWTQTDGIEGLKYIFFVNAKRGCGYGNGIWCTEDFGSNWKQVIGYEETQDLWNADFADSSSGWIVGRKQVWHSTDLVTWSLVKTLPATQDFLSVDFLSPSDGWITGSDGSVFRTNDGGTSWKIAKSPAPIGNIRFLSNGRGWAITTGGDVLSSDDQGITWKKQELPAP